MCGNDHWKRDCPSLSKRGKPTNFSFKKRKYRPHQKKTVANVSGDTQRYLEVNIKGHPDRLQLDTGADITLISRPTWMAIGQPHLNASVKTYRVANGQPLQIDGWFETAFSITDNAGGNHQGHGVCHVTESNDLLGFPWIRQLPDFKHLMEKFMIQEVVAVDIDAYRDNLVNHLKGTYSDVFAPNLGCCTKTKAMLQLKIDASPVFKKKRPVPYATLPLLNAEIDRLLHLDIISPVDHSDWAAPVVVVKKANGSIRLCADFSTGLNDALMLHQHPLPTAGDIFTKLNGGTIF